MTSLGIKTVPVTFTNKGVDYKVPCNIEAFRSYSDIQELIDALHAKGIRAVATSTNGCASDEKGHYHPVEINIHGITEKQARKLLR